jgi:hypothetical protein
MLVMVVVVVVVMVLTRPQTDYPRWFSQREKAYWCRRRHRHCE